MSPALLLATLLAAAPAHAVSLRDLGTNAPRATVHFNDGTNALRLHWFTPADWRPGDRRPAVVWIHGGAWVGGTLDGFMPHARYCAHRGAVGFNIEYRLARPAGPGIDGCITDCRAAIRYLRDHATNFGIDPARIAAAGDSAGGHLAAALATLTLKAPDPGSVPNALLLYNPVLDLTDDDWVRYAVGGAALADRSTPRPASDRALAQARALSPLHHVTPGLPPTRLLHGADDRIVPVEQARRFDAAMRAAGNRCELRVLAGTGHAFVVAHYKSPEPVVVAALRDADAFLGSLGWLAGPPTLIPSDPPAWAPLPAPRTTP
jgi:acetyl esterase/lipase